MYIVSLIYFVHISNPYFVYLWSTVEAPPLELSVPLQQLRVPEAQRRRDPRDLLPAHWNP